MSSCQRVHNVITDKELVKNLSQSTYTLVTSNSIQVNLDMVFDSNRYCSLNHLLRVTAYIFHFIRNLNSILKKYSQDKVSDQNYTIQLTSLRQKTTGYDMFKPSLLQENFNRFLIVTDTAV